MSAPQTYPLVRWTGLAKDNNPHATTMASATLLLTNLTNTTVWLIKQGLLVTGFRGWRGNGIDRVVVTVAASPQLYSLFADRCFWRERRQEGALTIYTWVAERSGVRIEWEDVCA